MALGRIYNSTARPERYRGTFLSLTSCQQERVANFNRYYTWSPSSVDTTLEYTPMLWGQRQIDEWTGTINETIRTRKVTHALGFNE